MSASSRSPLESGAPERHRGALRIYLGAAHGVGKTYAMLNEGRRRASRGTDVVVGFVETHGRPRTLEQVGDLPVMPRSLIEHRGTEFEEMDVDALLARRPGVALIDELAHINAPGSRNAKRWQDVEEVLDAGIDVISTVNIQHLESINDVAERITGVRQPESVPDEVVRSAEQVELVDQTPEALRRRMAHGNIYTAEKIDAAMANYFRPGNLAALRELALLWVADQVDVGLEDYRERHDITDPWETRERIVVALTSAPGTDQLIRRASRVAQRSHGDLIGVHVHSEDGMTGSAGLVEQHRRLLVDMGGEYHDVVGSDIADALVAFARTENATQIVLGSSQRSWLRQLTAGSVINRVVRRSGTIDVHVVSHDNVEPPMVDRATPRLGRSPLPARRRAMAWVFGLIGVPALTFVMAQLRHDLDLSTNLLLYLTLVVTTAATGGTAPALATAAAAFGAANWFFIPPLHHWTIADGDHVVALLVFLSVAVLVSRFVDAATRRAAEAARARSEARTLAALAGTTGDDDPPPALLGQLRLVFDLTAASLLRRNGSGWSVEAASGESPPVSPSEAESVEDLGGGVILAMIGGRVGGEDRVVLNAFAAQLAAAMERRGLRAEAGRAESLAQANALRGALLQAVSHDLRTPLASIKASVSSLRQDDVEWSPGETDEFLHTIDDETDRLSRLVGNLLDMSRIQAGVLQPVMVPVTLEEVVPAAIDSLGPERAARIDADLAESLPPVLADSALFERAVANVLANAERFAPAGTKVRVEAAAFGSRLDIRVVDRGPGIRRDNRGDVFQPFQRLGDNQPGSGVGLGLAVARGFITAIGGSIEIDDTPGGGTTVLITLPVAP